MTTFHTTATLATIGIGKGTISVALKIARGDDGIKPDRIDEVFTDGELEVVMTIIPKDTEQETIGDITELKFSGIARTGTFSTAADHYSLSMSFKKTEESESELPHFAHCSVKLEATRTGTASDQAGEAGVGGESLYEDGGDDI